MCIGSELIHIIHYNHTRCLLFTCTVYLYLYSVHVPVHFCMIVCTCTVCNIVHSIIRTPCIGLMGLLEKRRFQKFLVFCNDYEEADPKTHQGMYMYNCNNSMCTLVLSLLLSLSLSLSLSFTSAYYSSSSLLTPVLTLSLPLSSYSPVAILSCYLRSAFDICIKLCTWLNKCSVIKHSFSSTLSTVENS